MNSIRIMIDRWQREGVDLLPPAARKDVIDTFSRAGSVATPDVLNLYALVGGMGGGDAEWWSLWSLEEIARENAEPSVFGVQFSDYMVDCWRYRFRPNLNGTSSVLVDYLDGTEPGVIAESVVEFFELYAADATLLLTSCSLEQSRGQSPNQTMEPTR